MGSERQRIRGGGLGPSWTPLLLGKGRGLQKSDTQGSPLSPALFSCLAASAELEGAGGHSRRWGKRAEGGLDGTEKRRVTREACVIQGSSWDTVGIGDDLAGVTRE